MRSGFFNLEFFLSSLRLISLTRRLRKRESFPFMLMSWKPRDRLKLKLMSALGQKQTFSPQKALSALPPKADIHAVLPMSAKDHNRTFQYCSRLHIEAPFCFDRRGSTMKRLRLTIGLIASAWFLIGGPAANAAPCMIATLTGTMGGPPEYNGLAGPGTLVRYGDDSNNCSSVKMQFDAGRGTTMRLSQLNITSAQVNAVFFTHMHSDHADGFADLIQLRWHFNSKDPKVDVVCSSDTMATCVRMVGLRPCGVR
jgi:hypothetical protein